GAAEARTSGRRAARRLRAQADLIVTLRGGTPPPAPRSQRRLSLNTARAVDLQAHAADERCLVGGEIEHRVRHVERRRGPPARDRLDALRLPLGRELPAD